jgi:hydroxyacylglutathione hydrolase
MLSYKEPFALLLDSAGQAEGALRSLASIGLDNLSALFLPESLTASGLPLHESRRVEACQVDYSAEFVLDVRSLAEFEQGHLPHAHHIHLGYLSDRIDEVPESPVIHCKSGVRSLVASSLLERAGKSPRDVLGGYQAIQDCTLVKA